jgi:osmotically-inducible protein OsmY
MGGYENEVQPNGDGTARLVKTRVAWSLDGVQLEINDGQAGAEFLQEIADSEVFETITIRFASGVTYQGEGTITGEVQASSQNATATVKFEGQGSLTQQ